MIVPQTIQTLAVTGQISSSGSTDATVSTNVVNVATNDLRYGRIITLYDTTATPATSTTFVNSATQITLPAGTWEYEGFLGFSSASIAPGGNVSMTSMTGGGTSIMTNQPYRGPDFYNQNIASSVTARYDTNIDLHAGTALDGALSKCGFVYTRGRIVLTTSQTFGFKVRQMTADAGNPTSLMPGSKITYTKTE